MAELPGRYLAAACPFRRRAQTKSIKNTFSRELQRLCFFGDALPARRRVRVNIRHRPCPHLHFRMGIPSLTAPRRPPRVGGAPPQPARAACRGARKKVLPAPRAVLHPRTSRRPKGATKNDALSTHKRLSIGQIGSRRSPDDAAAGYCTSASSRGGWTSPASPGGCSAAVAGSSPPRRKSRPNPRARGAVQARSSPSALPTL